MNMNTQTGVEPSSGATAAAKGTPAGADQLARSGPAKAPLPSTLDFLSEDFDAAAALAIRPPLVPPDPEARPLDYVAKFRPLLPEEMPESLAGKQREVGSEVGMGAALHANKGSLALMHACARSSAVGFRLLACAPKQHAPGKTCPSPC